MPLPRAAADAAVCDDYEASRHINAFVVTSYESLDHVTCSSRTILITEHARYRIERRIDATMRCRYVGML